ncbi:FtsX-like permease family protein [Streptomyces jumonjinensis]|uniref:FtsX-like permease family protein n=1 Tax=Streptomyces jumonjinensis TaxID=1945 RepID=UPI0037A34739
MSARRIAFRIALRRVRHDRRRTLGLTAALLIPLTLAVALVTLRATGELPQDIRVAAAFGQSANVLRNHDLVSEQGVEQAMAGAPGALAKAAGKDIEVHAEVDGRLPVSSGGLQVDSFGYGLELDRPVHRGRFAMTEGRAPRAEHEVALSSTVAERLKTEVGDRVRLGKGKADAEVTGIAAIPTDTLRKFVLATPLTVAREAPSPSSDGQGGSVAGGQNSTSVVWFTPNAITPETAKAMAESGWRSEPRPDSVADSDNSGSLLPQESASAWILGLVVLVLGELGLVMGAVYAIVVRSNRRELGLLAAAGAGPKTRRSVITHQGFFVGLIATALAMAIGVGAAWLLRPWAAERSGEIWGTLRLDTTATAVLAVLGIVTPAIAARIAARGVGGDVVAALRDQAHFETGTPRRGQVLLGSLLTCGLLLIVAGGALKAAFTVMIGGLALVIGTGMLVARILPSTGNRADGFPLMQRIGARLLARSASRSATMGTVVASLTVLAGLVLAAMGGLTAEVGKTYRPNSPEGSAFAYATKMPQTSTVAAMADALGSDRLVFMTLAAPPVPKTPTPDGSPWTFWGEFQTTTQLSEDRPTSVMVVKEADLPALLDRAATTEETRTLAAGGAMVMDKRLAPGGKVALTAPESPVTGAGQPQMLQVSLDAVVSQSRSDYRNFPAVYVTTAGLKAMGGIEQPNSAYFYLPKPAGSISTEQEDRAREVLASDIGSGYFTLEVERGPVAAEVLRSTTVGSAVALMLVAATLAFLTVALATQEMRPDLSALAAAGADRRFRSLLTGVYAGQVTLLGVGMGMVVTAAVTPALLAALEVGWSLWPWLGLAGASAGAVAAAVLAGWIGGSRVTTLLRAVR